MPDYQVSPFTAYFDRSILRQAIINLLDNAIKSEEAKSTGLLNRLIAERERPQADVFGSGDPVRAAARRDTVLSRLIFVTSVQFKVILTVSVKFSAGDGSAQQINHKRNHVPGTEKRCTDVDHPAGTDYSGAGWTGCF